MKAAEIRLLKITDPDIPLSDRVDKNIRSRVFVPDFLSIIRLCRHSNN